MARQTRSMRVLRSETESAHIASLTPVRPSAVRGRTTRPCPGERWAGGTEGFLKVHVKKGSDKILGATLVARHAGEMISEITLAMVSGAGLGTLAKTIHPYPTQAEIIRKAGDAYNRTRLTPRVKGIFETVLSWRR